MPKVCEKRRNLCSCVELEARCADNVEVEARCADKDGPISCEILLCGPRSARWKVVIVPRTAAPLWAVWIRVCLDNTYTMKNGEVSFPERLNLDD